MSFSRPFAKRITNVPADFHRGNVHDFLHRHQAEAYLATTAGPQASADFHAGLLRRVSDTRNLRLAWAHLSRHGGPAPGPDGWTYADFSPTDVYGLAETLGAAIASGKYFPGPSRTVQVPKGGNRGFRPLVLRNIADRVVERGIVQIIQPLLDRDFDDHSFGYRPRRGHWQALTLLKSLVDLEQRSVCISVDLRDAFEHVPLSRLRDVLAKRIHCPEVVNLIDRVIEQAKNRGLRQGGPLSPLLLNIYLDHFLDRPWRRQAPSIPLIRAADDILIPCQDPAEADHARRNLARHLKNAGMPCKTDHHGPIYRLDLGEKLDFLGYQLQDVDGKLTFEVAPSAWDHLLENLTLAHCQPDSPFVAVDIIRGWIDQLGPCYCSTNHTTLFSQLRECAATAGFAEGPRSFELANWWKASYKRWKKFSKRARPSRLQPINIRSQVEATAPAAPKPKVVCYTDGSKRRFQRVGGWAYIVRFANGAEIARCGGLTSTTNNRAELMAAIRALESLPVASSARLITDSQYVAQGIGKLAFWKSRDWTLGGAGRNSPLKNLKLWQRLDELCQVHDVQPEWVQGHSGHLENERCDRMAGLAAKRRSIKLYKLRRKAGEDQRELLHTANPLSSNPT